MDSRDQARRLPAHSPQAGQPGTSFHTQWLRLVGPISPDQRGRGSLRTTSIKQTLLDLAEQYRHLAAQANKLNK